MQLKHCYVAFWIGVFCVVASVDARAATKVPTPSSSQFKAKWNKRNFRHDLLGTLLKRHVRNGTVDYTGIRKRSLPLLYEYLYRLANTNVKSIRGRNGKFAFWINAYNAVTLKAVLDRLPKAYAAQKKFSVLKVKGFWKQYAYQVSGRWVTLDQIENSIMRPTFKDARLHFAIVCASGGCPSLMSWAYTANKLDAQLTRVTRSFLASPRAFQRKGDTVLISQLFKWYRGDFTVAPYKHELGFIASFHPNKKTRAFLKKSWSTLKVKYLPYSWALNVR